MMKSDDNLKLFARQLATWAEQIIENGRTPFRRVDLFPLLQTSEGPCHPPLIFWINRQSMIAGGLIFLPDGKSDTNFALESAAATALGIRHFVTWEADQINIWESGSAEVSLATTLQLNNTKDPSVFHHRLYELIDQLKLLSVTGRISAEETSRYYLLNLLNETLELSLPSLLEHCRQLRSEVTSMRAVDDRAQNWNRLTALRLLCLLNWNLLPGDLPVETLLTASGTLLDSLPQQLNHCLAQMDPSPGETLPRESTVAFRHLLLRLQQLRIHGRENRIEELLRLLLQHWYGEGQQDISNRDKGRLLLNSNELAPFCKREISYSGAQLAANALYRVLDQRNHPAQFQGDSFMFNQPFQENVIHANFHGNLRPEQSVRRELAGHLRNSWPNRHLVIPGHLPLWVIEATHLLGLSVKNGHIELHLPAGWLALIRNTFFCELLFSNFFLEAVTCQDNDRHLLVLQRRQTEGLTSCVLCDGTQRTLELGREPDRAAQNLTFALELPDIFYDLFAERQLIPLTPDSEEAQLTAPLQLFAKSELAKLLWSLFSPADIPEEISELLSAGESLGWLTPEALYLKELGRLMSQAPEGSSHPDINKIIAQLFDFPVDTDYSQSHPSLQNGTNSNPVNRNLSEDLLQQLEISGIPYFPKTYLYRQATGPLKSYNFTPPLKLSNELLGQYELQDAAGLKIQIVGEETKEALLLASALGLTSIELPTDRQQTADMLDSYRQDLIDLHARIAQLCHRYIEQPQAVHRLQKKLWQQLPLPPLKWLSS